ncbi:hypothetical protein [Leptolyngbya sp. PCC 6406]|uniref:pyroglutamyl-peptidase I family protein n=1 Tax=Leptolyngbya sp. PCC 6406 TaxID=1173264 RepID=UPI0009074C96|nr:hypothetical protein [Leptolyngbya sp. PCC 6406]
MNRKAVNTRIQPLILLTSFAPWRAHQKSNASDDLLEVVANHPRRPQNMAFLRKLPVHFDLAPMWVMAEIFALRPDVVVCCGMAEARALLTLEQFGRQREGEKSSLRGHRRLQTGLNLPVLAHNLALTAISRDAGNYVCNHLYYRLLESLPTALPHCQGLFVHVPRLHYRVRPWLLMDFLTVLERLEVLVGEGGG